MPLEILSVRPAEQEPQSEGIQVLGVRPAVPSQNGTTPPVTLDGVLQGALKPVEWAKEGVNQAATLADTVMRHAINLPGTLKTVVAGNPLTSIDRLNQKFKDDDFVFPYRDERSLFERMKDSDTTPGQSILDIALGSALPRRNLTEADIDAMGHGKQPEQDPDMFSELVTKTAQGMTTPLGLGMAALAPIAALPVELGAGAIGAANTPESVSRVIHAKTAEEQQGALADVLLNATMLGAGAKGVKGIRDNKFSSRPTIRPGEEPGVGQLDPGSALQNVMQDFRASLSKPSATGQRPWAQTKMPEAGSGFTLEKLKEVDARHPNEPPYVEPTPPTPPPVDPRVQRGLTVFQKLQERRKVEAEILRLQQENEPELTELANVKALLETEPNLGLQRMKTEVEGADPLEPQKVPALPKKRRGELRKRQAELEEKLKGVNQLVFDLKNHALDLDREGGESWRQLQEAAQFRVKQEQNKVATAKKGWEVGVAFDQTAEQKGPFASKREVGEGVVRPEQVNAPGFGTLIEKNEGSRWEKHTPLVDAFEATQRRLAEREKAVTEPPAQPQDLHPDVLARIMAQAKSPEEFTKAVVEAQALQGRQKPAPPEPGPEPPPNAAPPAEGGEMTLGELAKLDRAEALRRGFSVEQHDQAMDVALEHSLPIFADDELFSAEGKAELAKRGYVRRGNLYEIPPKAVQERQIPARSETAPVKSEFQSKLQARPNDPESGALPTPQKLIPGTKREVVSAADAAARRSVEAASLAKQPERNPYLVDTFEAARRRLEKKYPPDLPYEARFQIGLDPSEFLEKFRPFFPGASPDKDAAIIAKLRTLSPDKWMDAVKEIVAQPAPKDVIQPSPKVPKAPKAPQELRGAAKTRSEAFAARSQQETGSTSVRATQTEARLNRSIREETERAADEQPLQKQNRAMVGGAEGFASWESFVKKRLKRESLGDAKGAVRRYTQFIADLEPEARYSQETLQDFRETRLDQVAPETVNKDMLYLRNHFKPFLEERIADLEKLGQDASVEKRWVASLDKELADAKLNTVSPELGEAYTDAEQKRLWKATEAMVDQPGPAGALDTLVKLLGTSGARPWSEARWLRVGDIDFENMRLKIDAKHIPHIKDNESRVTSIGPEAIEAMEKRWERQGRGKRPDGGTLILSRDNAGLVPFATETLAKPLRDLHRELGIEGKSAYSGRHWFATKYLQAAWELNPQMAMVSLQKKMGHVRDETTRRYVEDVFFGKRMPKLSEVENPMDKLERQTREQQETREERQTREEREADPLRFPSGIPLTPELERIIGKMGKTVGQYDVHKGSPLLSSAVKGSLKRLSDREAWKNELAKEPVSVAKATLEDSEGHMFKGPKSLGYDVNQGFAQRQMTKAMKVMKNIPEYAKQVGAKFKPIDSFMDWAEGSHGTYDGWLNRNVRMVPDELYNNVEYPLYTHLMDDIGKAIKESKIRKDGLQRVGVYLIDKQPGGKEKLLASGMEESMWTGALKALKPEEKALGDLMVKKISEIAPLVDRTLQSAYGRRLARIDGYFPLQRKLGFLERIAKETSRLNLPPGGNVSMDVISSRGVEGEYHVGGRLPARPGKSFTQPRTLSDLPFNVNALEVMQKFATDASHFVAFDEWLGGINKVIASDEFTAKFGGGTRGVVTQWLDTMATQGRSANRVEWQRWLRQNTAAAQVGWRPSSQFIHASNIPIGVYMLGREGMEVLPRLARQLVSDDPAFKASFKSWLQENAGETYRRGGGEQAVQELEESQQTRYQRGRNTGFAMQRLLDRGHSQVLVATIYATEMIKKGVELEDVFTAPVDRMAAHLARVKARRAVASPLYKDVPLLLSRGGDTARMAFQFTNAFLDQFSVAWHEGVNVGGRKLLREGDPRPLLGVALTIAATIATESAIKLGTRKAMHAATGYEPTGDDSYKKEIEHEAVKRIPGSQFAIGGYDMMMPKSYNQPIRTGVPAVDLVTDAGQAVGEWATDSSERSANLNRLKAAKGVASVAGIPGSGFGFDTALMREKGKLQRTPEREVAKKIEEHGWKGTPSSLRAQAEKEIQRERTDRPQTIDERFKEERRGIDADQRRVERLMKALPDETSEWITSKGLVLKRFSDKVKLNGADVRLTRKEQDVYFGLVRDHLADEVGKRNKDFDSLTPELKRRRWNIIQDAAHKRAENEMVNRIHKADSESGPISGQDGKKPRFSAYGN